MKNCFIFFLFTVKRQPAAIEKKLSIFVIYAAHVRIYVFLIEKKSTENYNEQNIQYRVRLTKMKVKVARIVVFFKFIVFQFNLKYLHAKYFMLNTLYFIL